MVLFKLFMAFAITKIFSNVSKIPIKPIIIVWVIVNVAALHTIVNVVFAENAYQNLLSNYVKLEKAYGSNFDENTLIYATGKIDGTSLLKDQEFDVEADSLVLARKVYTKYERSYDCSIGDNTSSRRTCTEFRWRLMDANYEYSPYVRLQDLSLSDQLLKEISIGTGSKRILLKSVDTQKSYSIDDSKPFIRNGSVYFVNNRSREQVGDIKVNFYRLDPKEISFLAKIKGGQLVALGDDDIDEEINTYDRVYSNGILSIEHFADESDSNLWIQLLVTFIVMYFVLGRIIPHYTILNPVYAEAESSVRIKRNLKLVFANLLILALPLLVLLF